MNKLFAAIIAAVFATVAVAPAFAAEAKKETSSAKEVVADKAEKAATPSKAVAKKAVSRKAKAATSKKRVRKAAAKSAPANTTSDASSLPPSNHHKSTRFVFGADAAK